LVSLQRPILAQNRNGDALKTNQKEKTLMGFFSRRPDPQASIQQGRPPVDQLILEAGQATDQVMLNLIRESRESSNDIRQYLAEQRAADAAWWAAHRRHQAEELEREYPGYREELNKQRAATGLPPV
jgi:hypothetical protein